MQACDVGGIILHSVQVKKVRLRKVKSFARCHTVSYSESKVLEPCHGSFNPSWETVINVNTEVSVGMWGQEASWGGRQRSGWGDLTPAKRLRMQTLLERCLFCKAFLCDRLCWKQFSPFTPPSHLEVTQVKEQPAQVHQVQSSWARHESRFSVSRASWLIMTVMSTRSQLWLLSSLCCLSPHKHSCESCAINSFILRRKNSTQRGEVHHRAREGQSWI
jgi:hypothetical protein